MLIYCCISSDANWMSHQRSTCDLLDLMVRISPYHYSYEFYLPVFIIQIHPLGIVVTMVYQVLNNNISTTSSVCHNLVGTLNKLLYLLKLGRGTNHLLNALIERLDLHFQLSIMCQTESSIVPVSRITIECTIVSYKHSVINHFTATF